jgi:uncharacterized protein YbjT (DUF2867 family)
MTVLVTGSTGHVGSEVVAQLVGHVPDIRALTRTPEKARFPRGVTPVKGQLDDPDAMREALKGVTGLFLLSAVTPEELTGSLITLSLARDAGVRNLVYLSVIHADAYTDTPHFAAKAAVERMIQDFWLAATILRPGYYMQNDAWAKHRILGDGVYDPPVGNKAVHMVDTRDLGEVAALALLRRRQASDDAPLETIDVVAPEVLTADAIAGIWSTVVGRPVKYGGDDLSGFENQLRRHAPGWMAHDMRLMMGHFQQQGTAATPGTDERLQALLGRRMRSYRDFAAEAAASWHD